jgi:hypothetical protein
MRWRTPLLPFPALGGRVTPLAFSKPLEAQNMEAKLALKRNEIRELVLALVLLALLSITLI